MNFSLPIFLGLLWLFAAPCRAQRSGGGRPQSVSKVVVYTRFLPGGSTTGLAMAFRHPTDYPGSIDTTDLNRAALVSGADFSLLLAEAKRKKHYPMKIAGIRFAGQMLMSGVPHAFLYCPPYVLIDLTERVNYLIPHPSQQRLDAKFAALLGGQ